MDQPVLDEALLAGDLANLATLNRLFGGRAVLRKRLPGLLAAAPAGRPVRILDVGSGAGDLCEEILALGRKAAGGVELLSLDFHPQIQAYARRRLLGAAGKQRLRFIRGDARRLPLRDGAVDVAICTLALHHFSNEDAVRVLSELRRVARRAVLVSDLERSRTAYAAVWLATRFTRNPMTRFDGPTSVRRAFTGSELRALACQAGWPQVTVVPEGWFRMSLISAPVWPGDERW